MATTLMPLDPAASPQQAARVLTIAARLLPAEIVAGRRARKMRGHVTIVLVVVIVLLGSWYGFAAYQKTVAKNSLADVTQDAQNLQEQQSRFADVVNVQNETQVIDKQLNQLLGKDLRWARLFDTLRATGAPLGIGIVNVDGQLANKNSATTSGTALSSGSGDKAIGSLVVTGTAKNKATLAKYVDALSRLKVIANPYLTSAVDAHDQVDFSLQLDITAEALGGRFTKSTGGN